MGDNAVLTKVFELIEEVRGLEKRVAESETQLKLLQIREKELTDRVSRLSSTRPKVVTSGDERIREQRIEKEKMYKSAEQLREEMKGEYGDINKV